MDLGAWLRDLGLEQYTAAFLDRGLTLERLASLDLDDDRLRELGVESLPHRRLLLLAVKDLPAPGTGGGETPAAHEAASPPADPPEGLAYDRLPTWLALPLREYITETHPRIRLHWMLDIAELAVRWVAALALSEVLAASGGVLPPAVARAVRSHIERPTLGRWIAILRELAGSLPEDGGALSEQLASLQEQVEAAFQPERAEGEGGTLETSLLVLRNRVAHGGGLSSRAAAELLAAHEERFLDLLRRTADLTGDHTILALGRERSRRMHGLEPAEAPRPETVPEAALGVGLLEGARWLPLWPLADYGPVIVGSEVQEGNGRGNGGVPQIYARMDSERLIYTPVGSDEAQSEELDTEAFRSLFRLDEVEPGAPVEGLEGFHPEGFLLEARVEAEDLVGRRAELDLVKSWLKGRTGREGQARIGWVEGGPGLGKSLLMARAASDLANTPPQRQGIYVHRFRAGDPRNGLLPFLALLKAALDRWPPLRELGPPEEEEGDLREAVRRRLDRVSLLEAPHPKAPPPRFLVILDGLDEVAGIEPEIIRAVRDLAVEGTVWLLAGRPDHGLGEAFRVPPAEPLFGTDGLPPMDEDDVRALLLEGLGNLRYELLARDEEEGEEVRNAFVEAVVRRARGLPLYVNLLLRDLQQGVLTVHDEGRLPDGLTAYYDELMARVGLSTVKRDLPLVVSLLASVSEPLDEEALAMLLARSPERADAYRERVARALREGRALLRSAPLPGGGEGVLLYHQSFRDYVAGTPGEPARGIAPRPPAPALEGVVQEARELLVEAADWWERVGPGPLRRHLLRHGNRYGMAWGAAGPVVQRLTDFAWLMARAGELPGREMPELLEDCEAALAAGGAEEGALEAFTGFLRDHLPELTVVNPHWPASRILLQLAAEHGEQSPVTHAAEEWLAAGHCDWHWLRRVRRPDRPQRQALRMRYEGHRHPPRGVDVLPGAEQFVSWSVEGEPVRLWEVKSGRTLMTFGGDREIGALHWEERGLLTWDREGALALWDLATGQRLAAAPAPDAPLRLLPGLRLADGRMALLSLQGVLVLWDGSGEPLRRSLHQGGLLGLLQLPGGKLVSWGEDGRICVLDEATSEVVQTFEAHPEGSGTTMPAFQLFHGNGLDLPNRGVSLVRLCGEDRLVSTDGGNEISTWELGSEERSAHLELEQGDAVWEIFPQADGTLLIVTLDRVLRWTPGGGDPQLLLSEEALADQENDPAAMKYWSEVQPLRDGWLMLVRMDGRIRFYRQDDGSLVTRGRERPYDNWSAQAVPLEDGGAAILGRDFSLSLWSPGEEGPAPARPAHDNTIYGGAALAGDRLLSWSKDLCIHLWDLQELRRLGRGEGHLGDCLGQRLPDGRILTASSDGALLLWDGDDGSPLGQLGHHYSFVNGLELLPDSRVVSRAKTMRLWDLKQDRQVTRFGYASLHEETKDFFKNDPDEVETFGSATALEVLDGPVTLGDKEYPHALITGWENGEVRYFDPVNGHIAGYFNEFDNVVDGETVFHQVRMLKLACGDVLVYSRQADRGELYFVKDDTRVGGLTLALAPEEEEVEPGPIRRAQLLDGNTIFLFSEAGLVGRWDGESGNCQGRWRTAEGLHAGAAMPHGVLVTVHSDRTLRIWDPGELDGGERIRQLEPGSELPLPEEAGEILGVEPVEDRGFITRHENGIVVWFDREAGQSVVTARERDLAAEHPALLGYVPRKLEDPNLRLEAGPWRGYAFSSRAVLTRVDRPAEAAWWYGPGQTRTLGLKENGRMQLTTGPVAEVLQLYRGAEPVPLDDLEAWREEQPAAVGRRPARALRLEDVASPGVVQGIGLAEEERRRLGHASLGLLHILQVLLRRNRKLYARIAGVEDPWALLAQVQKQLEEGGTGEPVGLEELAAELRDIAARRQSSLAYEQDLVRWLLARMGEDTA